MLSFRNASTALLIALVALLTAASGAVAAPGAYRILIAQANCAPPTKLQTQLKAFPDVVAVDMFEACDGTPTLAEMTPYDMVVSMSDNEYADPVAFGNVLADYVDSGGFVFEYAYDSEEGLAPKGRFAEQGYFPFIPADNPNDPVTLGEFDASSPLMQGVTSLATEDNTNPALAPGATLVAKWSDGRNLLAYKGRVVSASAYVGDTSDWSGDFARLTINAVRTFGRHLLSVSVPTGGGTVVSPPAGVNCALACSVALLNGTPVSLTPVPLPGFAFAGFSGACTGTACALTVDADKSVVASFSAFSLAKRAKLNRRKGTATLIATVGGPGQLTLAGRKVKARSRTAVASGAVKLAIKAKGKAAKALRKRGRAKVKVNVTYTPAGGLPVVSEKRLTLRLTPPK